jgi:putative spermidine/putrescine transport system substrate-binding protein
MQRWALIATAVFTVGILGGGALAEESLTIVSYGGVYTTSQREAYYTPFSKTTGTRIIEDDAVEAWPQVKAQVESKKVTWDIVNGETATIVRGCDTGLLEPFDWKLIDKSKLLPSAVQECGVGTIVQSSVLAYNADKIPGEKPTSVKDFWDLKKFPGKRGLRKSPSTTLEFALIADGVPHDKVYEVLRTKEGVDRAFKKLDEIKSNVVWWESSSAPPQLLADGEVLMTTSWSGRITQAKRSEGKNFVTIWDGQNYDVDFWGVVRGAPHKEQAMKFIAFATDPQRQAKQMEYISYGPTRVEAMGLLPAELAKELPSHPDNLKTAVRNDAAFWSDRLDDLTERFVSWLGAK